jgi:hypothetical protein
MTFRPLAFPVTYVLGSVQKKTDVIERPEGSITSVYLLTGVPSCWWAALYSVIRTTTHNCIVASPRDKRDLTECRTQSFGMHSPSIVPLGGINRVDRWAYPLSAGRRRQQSGVR